MKLPKYVLEMNGVRYYGSDFPELAEKVNLNSHTLRNIFHGRVKFANTKTRELANSHIKIHQLTKQELDQLNSALQAKMMEQLTSLQF